MLKLIKGIVYIEYAKANDLVAVGIYLFALFASQCTSVGKFMDPVPIIRHLGLSNPIS